MLKPIMMDRFYVPVQAAAPGQSADPHAILVVDRFYFDPREVAGSDTVIAPGTQALPPLMVPLLPPGPQGLASVQSVAVAPAPPPPPDRPPSASAAPLPPPAVPVVAAVPKSNRLIGVIQTGQFSAALVQTEQNSYAVKLGDRVSQSGWQLVEVQENSVILSDGGERLMLHVGDRF